MRRVAPAVILFLVCLLPGIAQAQSCPQPVVMLVGGTNPACAGQPVTLDAGPGWATYQWSPGGATTRMITVAPSATMSYSVTTTDGNGCSVTSQPMTVVVNSASYTPPAIQGAPANICPNGSGSAWIDIPSPDYATMAWTIQHGTILGGEASHSVSFNADSSAQPVVLTVTVADANGCPAQSSVTIPILTIAPPSVHTFEADVCPNGSGQVYVDGPASGSWSAITWTIEHGSLPYGNSSTSTSFTADGSGLPVVLHVSVRDYGLCEAQNSITIPIRTIPAPAIHTFEADVCPNGSGQVYVDGPASGGWSSISWTIEHGTLPYGSSSMSTSFTADGSGLPVVLTVHVRDYGLCEAQNSITIPIRTIPAPAIHTYEPNICPNGLGNVYIDGPAAGGGWSNIVWTIEHGSMPYGNTSMSPSFVADGSGLPVVLHVSVRDYGLCEAQNSITIPIRAITPPSISFFASPVCPGNMSGASIDGPASGGNWSSIVWSIEHGSLPWGNNSLSVSFVPDSSGQPVVLHVTVRDYGTCEAQNSITIQVQAPTAVSIQSEYSTICTDGYGAATIDPPPPGHTWSFINWTVDHGSVYAGQGTTRLNFQADGSGNAVVVHVWAQQDGSSCPAQSSVSIPTRTLTPPVIALATGSCPTTASVTNADDYTQFMWSSDNATITSSTFEPSVTFLPFHNGHVTLTVVVRDGAGCEATSSVGYDVTGLPDITMTLPGVPYCYGTPATASIPDGGPGVTYQWSLNSGQFLGSSTMPTVSFIPQADTLALTVTATNAQGCSATGTT
ncbi:MAG: large repetitive protein, partial [Thermoanaerobaculia bacterium]|nr:large repetitive protein [Thermoanaerobaculia bacterium]